MIFRGAVGRGGRGGESQRQAVCPKLPSHLQRVSPAPVGCSLMVMGWGWRLRWAGFAQVMQCGLICVTSLLRAPPELSTPRCRRCQEARMLFETLSPNIRVSVMLPGNPRGAGEAPVVYRVSLRSAKVRGRQTGEQMAQWRVWVQDVTASFPFALG